MNDYTVYMHISPSNKRYIGITKQKVEKRWSNGRGYKYNEHFTNAIKKYGWNNFKHIIIARGLSEDEAKWLEIELIREFNTTDKNKGYNITLGGEGTNGCKHTEEHKKKMSEAHKGENNPMYGMSGELNPMYNKHHTEESKKKMSEAKKGKHHTEESRKKISENNAKYWEGKERSEESKKKMSESKKGIIPWNKGKIGAYSEESRKKMSDNSINKKSVICLTPSAKKIFLTIEKASNEHRIKSQADIGSCCKGYRMRKGKKVKVKSAGKLPDGTKLVWRYLTWKHNKILRPIGNKIKRVA